MSPIDLVQNVQMSAILKATSIDRCIDNGNPKIVQQCAEDALQKWNSFKCTEVLGPNILARLLGVVQINFE